MIEDLEGEIWKELPGYNGDYHISNLGRVKSFKKIPTKILIPNHDGRGYYYVRLVRDGKSSDPKIHQLVAICFLDHKPDGHNIVVDHINDDSSDNRACNLQLVSPRYNGHKRRINASSKYVGVSLEKKSGKWVANISVNKELIRLGRFINEEDAAAAYQKALAELNEPTIIKRYEP